MAIVTSACGGFHQGCFGIGGAQMKPIDLHQRATSDARYGCGPGEWRADIGGLTERLDKGQGSNPAPVRIRKGNTR